MNASLSLKKALLFSTVALLSLTLASWKNGVAQTTKAAQDTVPGPDKKIIDLDEALNNIDTAKIDLEKNIRDIDWEKMNSDIKASMKNLDAELLHMNVDLKKSLQEIDVDKMKRDVDESVAKIDWDKIKKNIAAAKNIDMDKLKAEMHKAQAEIQKQKPQIEKSLQNARVEMEKAKVQLNSYKTFVNGLEQDGLINKKDGYKIEHKDGRLIINGKEQSTDVYNKYRTFLEKNKNFTLEKNATDLKTKEE